MTNVLDVLETPVFQHPGEKHPLPRKPTEGLRRFALRIWSIHRHGGHGCQFVQLAPLVCLKSLGRRWDGPEAERVTKMVLANIVANTDTEGTDYGLEQ
jgi:hypothetical protein